MVLFSIMYVLGTLTILRSDACLFTSVAAKATPIDLTPWKPVKSLAHLSSFRMMCVNNPSFLGLVETTSKGNYKKNR